MYSYELAICETGALGPRSFQQADHIPGSNRSGSAANQRCRASRGCSVTTISPVAPRRASMVEYNSSLTPPPPLSPALPQSSATSSEPAAGLRTAASAADTARLAAVTGLLPASVLGSENAAAGSKAAENRRRRKRSPKGDGATSSGTLIPVANPKSLPVTEHTLFTCAADRVGLADLYMVSLYLLGPKGRYLLVLRAAWLQARTWRPGTAQLGLWPPSLRSRNGTRPSNSASQVRFKILTV